MIVTRIERQKRHPGRVNVHLDGEFAFGLDEEVLMRHGLRKGDVLSEETRHALLGAEEISKARSRALRYLSYRLRSEREVRLKLAEKGFASEVIDRVVEQLRSGGLVDDRRFASAFAHDSRLRKATGTRLLRMQLVAKGVARPLADEVLAAGADREVEESAALAAARSLVARYRSSRKATPAEAERRRVAQFLQRRGFGWEVITPVLKTLFRDSDPQPEDTDDGLPRL
jgi:regulatory protein